MDLATEASELLRRDAQWAAVSYEGRDVERILSYWTEDAVVMPPGLPAIVGKSALREYVQASLKIPGFKINWASTEATVSSDGDMAYMLSENEVTVDMDGTPTTTQGRAVTIWRRDDGEWRCCVDIWNAGPAA